MLLVLHMYCVNHSLGHGFREAMILGILAFYLTDIIFVASASFAFPGQLPNPLVYIENENQT